MLGIIELTDFASEVVRHGDSGAPPDPKVVSEYVRQLERVNNNSLRKWPPWSCELWRTIIATVADIA